MEKKGEIKDNIIMKRSFLNIIYGLVIVVLIGTVGYFIFNKNLESMEPTISNFEVKKENGKMILYKVYSDDSSEKTGLEVVLVKAGTYEIPIKIIISPNKTKAVFNKWNNTSLKTEIYISNIDGTDTKFLTKQEVSEGSGGLNQDSLAWSSDGNSITYFESQLTCAENCKNPGDFISMKVTYQVNGVTGEKKVLSKESVY